MSDFSASLLQSTVSHDPSEMPLLLLLIHLKHPCAKKQKSHLQQGTALE